MGPFGIDCDLRRWGLKLAERGGKKREEASDRRHRKKAGGVAASPVGERRSVRTVAQQQPNDSGGSRVKQKGKTKIKTVPGREKTKAQSRVPVTALMAWPRFHSKEQNHRAPNRWQHRLKRERPTCTERNESLLESADGSMATVATRREKKPCSNKTKKNRLDSDRPSHGRPLHSSSFAQESVQCRRLRSIRFATNHSGLNKAKPTTSKPKTMARGANTSSPNQLVRKRSPP